MLRSTVLPERLRSWPPYKALRSIEAFLSRRALRLERAAGSLVSAAVIALLGMALAFAYVHPQTQCEVSCVFSSQLASNPFPVGVQNEAAFRILTPLVSYLLGLHGEKILITNLIFATLTLAALYVGLRHYKLSPYYAALCTIAFALSAPNLTVVYYNGFNDALAFLLLALAFFLRRHAWLFWLAFGLSVFNREASLFLVPWFVFLRWQEAPRSPARVVETLVALSAVMISYMAFRDWMSGRVVVDLNLQHYLVPLRADVLHFWRESLGFQWTGFFGVFKALWLLPLLFLAHAAVRREWTAVAGALLLPACAYLQLFFAWDSTRLLALSFPVMLLAWITLVPGNRYHVKHWLFSLVALNLLVPNIYTAQNILEVMHGWTYTLLK